MTKKPAFPRTICITWQEDSGSSTGGFWIVTNPEQVAVPGESIRVGLYEFKEKLAVTARVETKITK